MARTTKKATNQVKKSIDKKSKKTVIINHEDTVTMNITSAQYEGAVRAQRAIKELDPNLDNDVLRARFAHFGQIAQVFEAQMNGNILAD